MGFNELEVDIELRQDRQSSPRMQQDKQYEFDDVKAKSKSHCQAE